MNIKINFIKFMVILYLNISVIIAMNNNIFLAEKYLLKNDPKKSQYAYVGLYSLMSASTLCLFLYRNVISRGLLLIREKRFSPKLLRWGIESSLYLGGFKTACEGLLVNVSQGPNEDLDEYNKKLLGSYISNLIKRRY